MPPETPDADAAAWASDARIDLLLLPYNKHRDTHGHFVDGIGVAMHLAHGFGGRGVPIVMPVTSFSYQASFHRRVAELEEKRPELLTSLVVVPEGEIGNPDHRRQIQQIAGAASS